MGRHLKINLMVLLVFFLGGILAVASHGTLLAVIVNTLFFAFGMFLRMIFTSDKEEG